jgi:phosphopentomutase
LKKGAIILEYDMFNETKNEASYRKLNLKHYGADSYEGHQEIMGNDPKKPLMKPFS